MVCKGHVVKLNMVLRILMIPGVDLQILRRIQHFADTFCGSGAFGKQHKHTIDREHRIEDNRKVSQEGKNRSGLGLSSRNPKSAGHNHQSQSRVQEQIHQRVAGSHRHVRLRLLIDDILVCGFEPLFFIFRFGEGLDHPDSGSIFTDNAGHPVHRLLQLGIERNAPSRNIEHRHRDKRKHCKKHQRQNRLHKHGHCNSAQQQNRRTDSQPLHHSDHLMDVIGVRGQTGFQRGNRKGICLAAGQVGDPPEQIVTQALRRVPRNSGRHPIGNDVACPRDHRADQHQKPVKQNLRHIFLWNDHIDQERKNPREKQVHDCSDKFDRDTENHFRDMRAQIKKYFFQ